MVWATMPAIFPGCACRGLPDRGASASPAMPILANLLRHSRTVGREQSTVEAISLLIIRSAAASTFRALCTSRCAPSTFPDRLLQRVPLFRTQLYYGRTLHAPRIAPGNHGDTGVQ